MFMMFCVIAIAPIALFWLSPNSRIFESEIEEVSERHLIIARGIAGELDRYHQGLVSTFLYAVEQNPNAVDKGNLKRLFANFSIRRICFISTDTGAVARSIDGSVSECPVSFNKNQLQSLGSLVGDARGRVITSGVVPSGDGQNVFYLLYQTENILLAAEVDTGTIREIGDRVRFGIYGHAAIVDQAGKAISHPKKSWVTERRDLGKIPVVKRMVAGETGVETFYSPAFDNDVIAGFAAASATNWGVLVAQPINELQAKADSMKSTGFTVLAFGVFLAGILAFVAAKFLTDPIEQMVKSMNKIGAGELRAYEHMIERRWHPREFGTARESIKAMSVRFQENIDTISRHAYLDGVTGLPNRECFRVLAQEEIEKMQSVGGTCAILFLDLDGFKQVNDVYGHRSGDDLLKGFAAKLHAYCGYAMKQNARGADNGFRILPARLGGDEFVVMLSNLRDETFPRKFADGLFRRVFGTFMIHNGVSLQVGGSVGGALFPQQAGDFDELLRLADIAMYAAKNSGKGRYCQYSPEQVQTQFGGNLQHEPS